MPAIPEQLRPQIKAEGPILIAGPTASGKSSLALDLAEQFDGCVINADAIQVFDNWRVLTARPPREDELRAEHLLYGHISKNQDYSVGHWLRDIVPLLTKNKRPIIVGGTGLYFTALTEGLANIPPTPPEIRDLGNRLRETNGIDFLLSELDEDTKQSIDTLNPMRVQRAWEVLRATGKSIKEWQREMPAPLLSLDDATPIVFDVDKEWLNERIARRFDIMLETGALEEAEENFRSWDPDLLSSKAIGAPELIAYVGGQITLDEARERATIATRQFAKRQRTWFRSKMKSWIPYSPHISPK